MDFQDLRSVGQIPLHHFFKKIHHNKNFQIIKKILCLVFQEILDLISKLIFSQIIVMDLNLDSSKITKVKIKIQDFNFSKINFNMDQIINSKDLIKISIVDFKIMATCLISLKASRHSVKEVDLEISHLVEGFKIVRIF